VRINILAIESSCDETAAAVIGNGKLLNNIIASQSVHAVYGGVVPELASRAHERTISGVVREALVSAGITMEEIDAVAYTQGPGLMGSLLVGSSFAKGISVAMGIPMIGVNHMQAHVLAHWIPERKPSFPFLCLTVSGGHTQLVLMRSHTSFELVGQTLDDAAGEAFDKGAKMLGLPYPGGPMIDKLAALGNPLAFQFPFTRLDGFDFSFSGIKTALLYLLRDNEREQPGFTASRLNDLCASYQFQVLRMLMDKLEAAALHFRVRHIGIAGGVASNSGLRRLLSEKATQHGWDTFVPHPTFCTDNAAMIAVTAHYKYLAGEFTSPDAVPVTSLGPGFSL